MIFNMKNMKFTVEVTTEPEGNHFYRLKAVQSKEHNVYKSKGYYVVS